MCVFFTFVFFTFLFKWFSLVSLSFFLNTSAPDFCLCEICNKVTIFKGFFVLVYTNCHLIIHIVFSFYILLSYITVFIQLLIYSDLLFC